MDGYVTNVHEWSYRKDEQRTINCGIKVYIYAAWGITFL